MKFKDEITPINNKVWNPFTLPFPITFVMTILPTSIYHNGPSQSNRLSWSYLRLCLLMHPASSKSYITFRLQHISPRAPLSFLFTQTIPKAQNIKGKTRNKQEEDLKTNNNMTPQKMWYGHTLDINKATNQAQQFIKDQKHKTNNKHHDSIPKVPGESSTRAFFKIY